MMELTQPFQNKSEYSAQFDKNSQFLVVNSEDVQRIEALTIMFPRLSNMIRNSAGKNLVLNFRDEQQRSLIVMVVSKPSEEPLSVQLAS